MAMRMTGKTAKHSQKSATIDRHAPVWMSSKQLRVLLLALSMLAVFLPAMPNARANEASTSLAEVLETIGADELHDLGVDRCRHRYRRYRHWRECCGWS